MTPQRLPEMAVFYADVATKYDQPDLRSFTFAELCGYFEMYGRPLPEEDQVSWFFLLCGEDYNQSRVVAYQKVLEWRDRTPIDDPRRKRSAKILNEYKDGLQTS